jgi:hypothetical protein
MMPFSPFYGAAPRVPRVKSGDASGRGALGANREDIYPNYDGENRPMASR